MVGKLLLQASITERRCRGRVGRPSTSFDRASAAAGGSFSEHVTPQGGLIEQA